MSLPGIRPRTLDGGRSSGGGGMWDSGRRLLGGDASTPHNDTATILESKNVREAGVDHLTVRSSRDLNSQQLTLQGSEHGGQESDREAVGGSGATARIFRNKPVKWSVEEDRRLREAVNKVISLAKYRLDWHFYVWFLRACAATAECYPE